MEGESEAVREFVGRYGEYPPPARKGSDSESTFVQPVFSVFTSFIADCWDGGSFVHFGAARRQCGHPRDRAYDQVVGCFVVFR